MNPYLVKELRQLTRSKIVSGGLVLLLFGQLAAAAIAIPAVEKMSSAMAVAASSSPGGAPDTPPLGLILAGVFGGILGLALTVVMPFLVFARFVGENPKGRTLVELATAAPPSAVIDGKVQAGLVLAAALVAGSMPFQLLCVALRGVDFVTVLLSAAGMLLACSVQLHFAALFAAPRTASAGRRWATMVLFQFFFGQNALLGGVAMAAAAAAGGGGASFLLRSPATVWGGVVGLLAATSLNLLLRAQATRSLAAPSTDRDRVPRLTLLALWAVWGAVAAVFAAVHSEANFLWAWGGVFAAAILLSFLSSAGAPPGVPRRILAERPASRRGRLLRLPFSAACPGGLFLSLALLAATVLLAALLAAALDPDPYGSAGPTALLRVLACTLYALSVPLILRGLLFRLAPQRLPLVPTLSFALLLLLQLLPLLLVIGHGEPPDGFPFFIPGVFGCEDRAVVLHLVFSGVALVAGFAAAEPEVFSSLRAYLSPPASPPPESGTDPARGARTDPTPSESAESGTDPARSE